MVPCWAVGQGMEVASRRDKGARDRATVGAVVWLEPGMREEWSVSHSPLWAEEELLVLRAPRGFERCRSPIGEDDVSRLWPNGCLELDV